MNSISDILGLFFYFSAVLIVLVLQFYQAVQGEPYSLITPHLCNDSNGVCEAFNILTILTLATSCSLAVRQIRKITFDYQLSAS